MERIILTVTNDLNFDQRMSRICTSLHNNGFTVLLVGRKHPKSIPLEKQPFQQTRLSCFFHKGKLFYIEYNIRLLFFLLWNRFDIVCGVDLDTILPCYLVSRIKRKKVAYDAHEYFTELPEVIERPITQNIWKVVASITIPRSDFHYTVCGSLATIFYQQYGVPFTIIRNLPKSHTFSNTRSDHLRIILYQGVLNEGRGLEAAIAAMQYINDAELWLAGEGDLSKDLRERVKKMNLESKVKFLGYLRPDELRQITLKSWVGLNLLENKGLNYFYSLANKTFDYIQAEVPALHMDFPEYRLLNQQYNIGVLIEDLKEESITKALQKMVVNTEFYDKLVQNCRIAKKELVWEKEETKLIEIYKQASQV